MKINLLFYRKPGNRILLSILIIFLAFGASTIHAQPQPPSFSKIFDSDEIGPGSVSTLTFTIDNSESATPATDLAFIDSLPAGVTIATPSNARVSEVTGTLTTADGGATISYSDGRCGGGKTLTISVDVTCSTEGVHTNTTGDLTSSLGNSGTASDDLTVLNTLPGFSKSFSPDTINYGERTTLTFIIDNSANATDIGNIDFTDNLPSGMVVANPANISFEGGSPFFTTTLTALPGSGVIVYDANGSTMLPDYAALRAGETITISVDVLGNSAASLINVTELLADFTTCGKASTALEVLTPNEISIRKSFSPNPVPAGGTANLEYTIENRSRRLDATNISFTDDLDAALTGLVATGLPAANCEGTVSGTSVISYSGGSLAAGTSCTFSVPVLVPASTSPGTYTSTTDAVTADFSDRSVTGNTATENLFVASVPTISKRFLDNPIAPGGTTTLEFTITNTDPDKTLRDISFTDNISNFLRFFPPTISNLPDDGSCGPSSSFQVVPIGFEQLGFQMSGGSLAAGDSYTFTIDIDIPSGFPGGTYTNTTSVISGEVNGVTVQGNPASDDLEILELPRLSMSFTDDPVLAGGTATLGFTLTYVGESVSGEATNISFTDDLNAVIPGLEAVGLPLNDVCGTGSQLSGTSSLSLTGGNMSPGDIYTFSVPVQVPADALPGSYSNTTSTLSATVGGLTATNNVASDDLAIAGLSFTAEFIDDPVIPGDLTKLRFTIDNSTTEDAIISDFTNSLSSCLSGLAAEAPLPTSLCGSGANLSGTTFLGYTGGNVMAGTSCSFDVMCRVPASAASGTYNNVTSSLEATINGSSITVPSANDDLVVNNNLIELSKTFTDDPVVPGSTVTVEYTLTNLDPARSLTNIAFTDDFDGALTDLVATGLPATSCGGTLSGTGLLDFSGGSLAAGESCTFNVSLQTPVTAPFGASITSTTSSVTGEINGLSVAGEPAYDNLDFTSLQISKAFSSPVSAGVPATLTFMLTNPDQVNPVSNIRFTDNLEAFITGATANNLPMSDVCGAGSTVTGSSLILFTNGSLAANETKTFDVTVHIPCGTAVGDYLNTTSTITADGNFGTYSINPVTANLTIIDNFTPGAIFATGETICYGGNPAAIGNSTAASGGDESITYKWESSTNGFATVGTVISGATASSYNPPAGLTATTSYRRYANDGTCNTTFEVSTGTWMVTVNDDFTAGAIFAIGETICYGGDPVEIGNSTAASGGDKRITYKWESSTDGFATAGTVINGATASSYNPPVGLTATTSYRRYAHDGTCNTTFEVSTGTWMLTVNDSPVANCKNITVYLDAVGSVSIDSSDVNDGSTYDCELTSIALNKSDFDCANIGENTVTLTITDVGENTDLCTSTVTVLDTIAPTIETNIASVTLEIESGECATMITYPELMASDNCDVTLTKTAGLGADGLFPLGTTTETWLATDAQGNTAEVSFDVTITATNALPTIDAINDTVVMEDTYSVIVPLTGITSGNDCEDQDVMVEVSSDNAELVTSMTLAYTQGDTNASINLELASEMSGESEITLIVTDSGNDTISETFKVTITAVNDAPFLINPIENQSIHASSSLTLSVPQALGVLFDDIDDEELTFTMAVEGEATLPSWATFNESELTLNPMIADTGCIHFVITATDSAGASASDTFEVCVLDYMVSIGELTADVFELKIYPNPTKGLVTIEPKTAVLEDIEVAVMNIAGREVYQKTYRSGDPIRFNMSEHVSGMYMVIVKTNNHRIVKKLILDKK